MDLRTYGCVSAMQCVSLPWLVPICLPDPGLLTHLKMPYAKRVASSLSTTDGLDLPWYGLARSVAILAFRLNPTETRGGSSPAHHFLTQMMPIGHRIQLPWQLLLGGQEN